LPALRAGSRGRTRGDVVVGVVPVLTITKLKGAEYLIASVADGMEDYFMGAGEAPGVWRGAWAASLGVEGVVRADELRALVNGLDPDTGDDLLVGHRERKVRAVDVTLSVPKSVSLLWAFGTPETSAAVSIAVVEATDHALSFLEERTAVARHQQFGVRRRVPTGGFAIATFAHRTSRAGDPQLHTHCLIPNVVRRADGVHVAFDANPLHVWGKAAGTVFLNQLERNLTSQLGVAWGPERNGCREIVGFSREQLRAFSKRTVAIETHLEAAGELAFDSNADRMRADDRASRVTRDRKDKTLTPERLRDRWQAEAEAVGLHPGAGVDNLVIGRQLERAADPNEPEILAALVDPATGLCATQSRFGEAHVVERVAAISGGRCTLDEILTITKQFLGSEHVVRLTPDAAQRRPAEWSTVELRQVEDQLLAHLRAMTAQAVEGVAVSVIDDAVAAEPKRLGADQIDAVRVLCGAGPSVRVLVAPAGFGKTTALHAAATAVASTGRPVVVVAPTHKAVGELRAAGLDAQTIARFCRRVGDVPLEAGTTVIVDEMSQVGTRDAAALIGAVTATSGSQVWFVGDVRQAQSVAAGGLAAELERLAAGGAIPAVGLAENRRQRDPAERAALTAYRAGDVDASQLIRTEHGWEHDLASPTDTREALAQAAITDADRHGVEHVAVLAVSHTDCEDLADRIRAIRADRGELRGPTLQGPGWGPNSRTYAPGDRILVHANLAGGAGRAVCNGSTATVLGVTRHGLDVMTDDRAHVRIDADIVAGCRADGSPNVSHAWARTVDGAQGGTWRQVHLLATPTLDRHTGYVAQSRGQLPTHTWNTRPDRDHPASLLADDRSPAEAVVDAMRRNEPKTFAASDDPFVLDRELRAERAEHGAVIAARPPDLHAELEHAHQTAARAADEHHWATRGVILREDERAQLGPLARLRRAGRDDIIRHDQALTDAHTRLETAERALHDARADTTRLEAAVAEHAAWDRQHGWRFARLAEIDRHLAHHWADTTLQAVRADDPLAFGVQHLRNARNRYQTDLHNLTAALPVDRRQPLKRAETDLRRHLHSLRNAERQLANAHAALEAAHQRHWGRRDKHTIEQAHTELAAAERNRETLINKVTQSKADAERERHAVRDRETATRDTANERARLSHAIDDLDTALTATRPARIAAAAKDPNNALWHTIGPPPPTRGGLATWCGIAEHIETEQDHPQPNRSTHHRTDDLTHILGHANQIIDAANQLDPTPTSDTLVDQSLWQPALTAASHLVAEHAQPDAEQALGLEL